MHSRYFFHGAVPALAAACCFSAMTVLVKFASAEAPSQVLVFLRALFGLLIVTPFALRRGTAFLKTTRVKLHALRAVVSIGAMSCFFFAVSQIGLAEAILLNASSPLFIGVLAIFMLGEHLDRRATYALAIGFCGVVLLLKPGTSLFQIGAMTGALSGLLVAFAKVFIRQMADTEPVLRTVFYFGVFSTLFCLIPLVWLWQTPSLFAVSCMLAAAAFATIGQTCLTYAFSHNRAALVAPFSYVTVVLGGCFGWLVWDEVPDMFALAGAALVIAGCISMVLRPKTRDAWRGTRPAAETQTTRG